MGIELPSPARGLSVAELLHRARSGLRRVSVDGVAAERAAGALLVDIRSESQRARDGLIPGALFVERNVLEWRADPHGPDRDPALGGADTRLILVCHGGYQSSLAAAVLQLLGRPDATDLIGGFQAWAQAGMPVHRPSHDPLSLR